MTDSEFRAIIQIYDQGFAEEYEQKLGQLSMVRNHVQHLEDELFTQLHLKLLTARKHLQQRESELLGHLDNLTKLAEQLVHIMVPLRDIDEQFHNLNLPEIFQNIYEVYGHLSRMLEVEKRKQFDRHYHV